MTPVDTVSAPEPPMRMTLCPSCSLLLAASGTATILPEVLAICKSRIAIVLVAEGTRIIAGTLSPSGSMTSKWTVPVGSSDPRSDSTTPFASIKTPLANRTARLSKLTMRTSPFALAIDCATRSSSLLRRWSLWLWPPPQRRRGCGVYGGDDPLYRMFHNLVDGAVTDGGAWSIEATVTCRSL